MNTLYSRVKKLAESDVVNLPLPSTDKHLPAGRPFLGRWLTKRLGRVAFAALLFLTLTIWFRGMDNMLDTADIIEQQAQVPDPLFPPLYSEYHERELQLPQHNPDVPYPEGRNGKYIWIANHVEGSGWGNAMQELIVDSHLAYKAGRSFVFDNYTWNRDGPDYSDYEGRLIPSRIPLSAMITGPTAGGPFPEGDLSPRSVAKEYWDEVCEERTVIDSATVTRSLPDDATAMQILNAWVEKLNSIEDHCVEIQRGSLQLFGIWVMGTERVLDVWPSLSTSPIITQFGWSPLIHSAFDANRQFFSPKSALEPYLSRLSIFKHWYSDPYSMLPGLLVLHIRRGDFRDHCIHLAKWRSQWNGFNSFPALPDKFSPPESAGGGETTEENKQFYLEHCLPTIEQIVKKVEDVKKTKAGKGLKNIYVMTNGPKPWVKQLKTALEKNGRWSRIVSSGDIELSWEQKYVAQAVDMMIGQRAQVIVGNGFSSLTSNIVMLRMAKGLPPDSNRFW